MSHLSVACMSESSCMRHHVYLAHWGQSSPPSPRWWTAWSTAVSVLPYQTSKLVRCRETESRTGELAHRHNITPVTFTHASMPTGCTHIVNRDHGSSAGAASADLLHNQAVRQIIHPSSTQLLGYLDGQHPHRPQLLNLDNCKIVMCLIP